MEADLGTTFLKNEPSISVQTKMYAFFDPVIPLPGTGNHLEKQNYHRYVHEDVYETTVYSTERKQKSGAPSLGIWRHEP